MSKTLTSKELFDAVATLKKNERKPKWRFTWEFPFLKKFYIFTSDDLKAGKSIDYYVSKELTDQTGKS